MTKKKSTKRALISSLLILAMCFTMLAGTTFAWFTDSVTSTGNKIVAGKLDIALYMATSATDFVEISDSTSPIFGKADSLVAQNVNADTLWEPGKTQVAYLKLENKGNLALKYKVAITVKDNVKDLYKVMTYAIVQDATFGSVTAMPANAQNVVLGTQETAVDVAMQPNDVHLFALAVHMDEDAGNEYQEGSVSFDMIVLATQLASEYDSFNNQYDANAADPVASQGEFETALAAAAQSTEPATVVLSAGDYTIPAGTTIENLTIEGKEGTVVDTINISSGANTTLKNFTAEGVTFESSHGDTWKGILSTPTTLEDATFKNCTFSTEGDARDNNIYDARMKGNVVFDECTIYGDVYGINFGHVDGTLTIKNSEVTGWNSFGGATVAGDPSKVVIENCNFHQSDYNKLRFYQDAEVKNCTFDTEFFDPSVSQVYGSFEGGIDAATSGISVTLTGCKIKNVGTGALTDLYDNYVGYVKNCTGISNVTWNIDGNNVSANVPGNSTI